MRTAAWKMADIVVTGLIALVLGVLFSWWVGATVFLLGLAIVLRPKPLRPSWLSRKAPGRSTDEENEWYYYRYRLHHGDIRKE